MENSIYEFVVKDINGNDLDLRQYQNHVLLIVNTASKCGFTSQYAYLEKLYLKYKDRGFMVLAFPSGQFLNQEFAEAEEIKNFCSTKYQITFPLLAKIDVNGDGAAPIFKYLKNKAQGIFGIEGIKWNFTKFLINKNGEVVKRFPPITNPLKIASDIEKLL